MYDVHSHILYDVDDGSVCIDESVQMAEQAAANGIEAIIATPHYIEGLYVSDYQNNLSKLYRLSQEIERAGIEIDIYLGNEVLITPDLTKLIKSGKVAALNNSRYVLIELPFSDIPSYTEKVLFNLEMDGYIAVLAHPERNEYIINDLNILYRFIKQGALVQINIPSIEGVYGKWVKKTALLMIKHNLVHFLGTDTHTPQKSQTAVKDTIKMLKDYYPDQADNLLFNNSQCIIRNEPIKITEPRRIRNGFNKKSIFNP